MPCKAHGKFASRAECGTVIRYGLMSAGLCRPRRPSLDFLRWELTLTLFHILRFRPAGAGQSRRAPPSQSSAGGVDRPTLRMGSLKV